MEVVQIARFAQKLRCSMRVEASGDRTHLCHVDNVVSLTVDGTMTTHPLLPKRCDCDSGFAMASDRITVRVEAPPEPPASCKLWSADGRVTTPLNDVCQ